MSGSEVRRVEPSDSEVRRVEPISPSVAGPAVTALRLAGATFPEIAETLGIANAAEAQTLYFRDLGQRVSDEDRRHSRMEAKARLERLLRSTWRKATTERDPEHLAAVRVAQGIVDRLIKLEGLDAPTEVVVHAPTVAEIDAWVARVVAAQPDNLPDEPDIVDADVVAD